MTWTNVMHNPVTCASSTGTAEGQVVPIELSHRRSARCEPRSLCHINWDGTATLPSSLNPYLVYRAQLANPSSRRAMIGCLDRIARLFAERSGEPNPGGELFPWHLLRYQHTAAIRGLLLSQGWSPAYARKHVAALRSVLRVAWKLGLITADEHAQATNLEPVKGTALPTGRSINSRELEAMLQVCADDPTPAGVRDAALIAVLYSTGSRRGEVAAARREHYDPGERELRVHGKGDQERITYLQEAAAVLLGRWLALTSGKTGPIFVPISRWGRIGDRPLSPEAIRYAVNKRRKQAQLPPLTPHDFRRTFIGDVLDGGADLATAQDLAGHASPVTTARYDRRPGRTRKAAVDRLHVPRPPGQTRSSSPPES